MACNPRWSEIAHVLKKYFIKGTTVNDIPIIVNDIFQTKVKHLIKDLIEKNIMGPIVDYVYTIEFQKRGLPHAHILAALRTDCKLLQPNDVDRFRIELYRFISSLRVYMSNDLMNRIILSPQNDEVNRMNEKKLSKTPGEQTISYSIDNRQP
ncbi:hypothetical protein JTE90_007773 [Oedothorax gibbosus]|uniref:Helitron helicase-like domain-containing protein n=1 Tax=Oedothorax gibbosus TaxID=931172 RepID=A0AAV6TIN8_9ARAC|nr:hypothetical protein JTE90_007773 [Oedothorax gibbosus]